MMSDIAEQITPSHWTDKGGMQQQQESANEWAKEILQAASAREQAGKDRAMEHGMER